MEPWIWLIALALSALVTSVALVTLVSQTISLVRKLKPFLGLLDRFKTSAKLYPEAVKFLSELGKNRR